MVLGAGALGSVGACGVLARLPCSLRLNPLASLIFSVVASVVSNAFTKRVDNAFSPSNACTRAFTALLYAVFLDTTSANAVCAVVANVFNEASFRAVFEGL